MKKIKAEKEKAQAVVYEVSAELYKQNPEAAQEAAGQAEGQAQGETTEKSDNKDDVVDAEYTEVEKK